MIRKLITPESPLLVPPLLAAEIGLSEAIILQQIHYYCLISQHTKQDGRRWFWKTLNDWGQTLPFLSVSTIRRAIANLKDKFKLIDIERHSQKTWYQANWFTINAENVEALWSKISHLSQIDMTILDKSSHSKPTDDIKDFPPQEFSSKKQAAELENCLEPDWDTAKLKALAWEQEQLNRLEGAQDQSTPTPVADEKSFSITAVSIEPSQNLSTLASDRATTPPVNELIQNLSTIVSDRITLPPADKSITNSPPDELTPRCDVSPVPADEHQEENIKICEVRNAVGKLTPNLKKLIGEFALSDWRKALVLYRQRQQKQHIRDAYSWLRKCLEQRWWQDKSAHNHAQSVAVPQSVAAKDKLTQEQKDWYERAIAAGICLQASIEELPVKMGRVCARVRIPNPRPYDSPFELFAIEDLMIQYPLLVSARSHECNCTF